MTSRLTLLVVAALAACSPRNDDSPPPPPAASALAEVPQSTPVDSLAGEYRVAGISDGSIDAPIGLSLSISDRRIVFDGPCGGAEWDYQLSGTRLRTVRIASPDDDCMASAQVQNLAIAVVAALDAATQVGRTPSNGIALSGDGQSVTLYSQ